MVEHLARIPKSAPTQRHSHPGQTTTMGGIVSTAPTPEPTYDWIKDRVSQKGGCAARAACVAAWSRVSGISTLCVGCPAAHLGGRFTSATTMNPPWAARVPRLALREILLLLSSLRGCMRTGGPADCTSHGVVVVGSAAPALGATL